MAPGPHRPLGAVLLLCLLLLLSLSLLGLAAASDLQVQERVNGNIESSRQGEAAARMGSLWARGWLRSLGGETPPPLCAETCPEDSVIHAPGSIGAQPEAENANWWRSEGHAAGTDPLSGADSGWSGLPAGAEAHWLIEQLRMDTLPTGDGGENHVGWYRILARGATARPGSEYFSEAIVARPWGDPSWQSPLPPQPDDPNFCVHVPEPLACGPQVWQDLP